MPTGYTAAIADGINFQQFVLQCARAFGALIEMRDEPMDAKIPDHFEESDYHRSAIELGERRLAELQAMTQQQAEEASLRAYLDANESAKKRQHEIDDLRNKYNAMLVQVVKWEPPTSEHAGLKDFMLEQIRNSIKFDCHTVEVPIKKDGATWLRSMIECEKRSIDYHRKEAQNEAKRTQERNAWVKSLRESLLFGGAS